VVAPARLPVGAAVGAGLAAGALLATFFSPAAGLLAAGGGLVMTRGLSRMQKKRVKHTVIRPVEQQVLEQFQTAVAGHKSAVTSLCCSPDGRRLSVVTKFGECASWELDTDGYKVSAVRLPPFEQSALASGSPKAVVATGSAVLVADLLSGAREEIAVDATAVATTPDAGKLAFGRQQGQVQVVEVASKR